MRLLSYLKDKIQIILPVVIGLFLCFLGFILQLGIYSTVGFENFPFLNSFIDYLAIDNSFYRIVVPVSIFLSIIIFFVISFCTKYEYNNHKSLLDKCIISTPSKISKRTLIICSVIESVLFIYLFFKLFILNTYHGFDGLIWLLIILIPALVIFLYEYKMPEYNQLKLLKGEVFFLFCVFIFLLSISLPALSVIPFVVHYDEATIGNLAREFMNSDVNIFALNKWYGYPNFSFYPAYLVLKFISNDLWGLRLYGVITILISVIPFFYFARFLFNKEIAAISSIIMYSSHCLFFFFRNGMYHTDGLIIYSLVGFFLIAGLKMNSKLFLYLSGVFCALGFYVYMSARVMIIIVVIYLFLMLLMTLEKRQLLKHLVLLIAGFMICIFPLGLNIVKNPELSVLRANQINILTSKEAYRHASGPYKLDSKSVTFMNTLLNQLWVSIKSFNSGKDKDRQYSVLRPFFDIVTSFLFLLGLPYTCILIFKAKKKKWFIEIYDERYLLLALSFWIILILAWVINVDPPTYQKMPIILPAVSIICAFVLYNIAYYVVKNFKSNVAKATIKIAFLSIVLIGIIIANFEVFLHSGTVGLERNDFYLTDTLLGYYANDKLRKEGKAKFYLIGFRENLSFSLDFLSDKDVKYVYLSNKKFKQSKPIDNKDVNDLVFAINPKYDRDCDGINYLNYYYPGGRTKIIKNLKGNITLILYYVSKTNVSKDVNEAKV